MKEVVVSLQKLGLCSSLPSSSLDQQPLRSCKPSLLPASYAYLLCLSSQDNLTTCLRRA